MIFLCLEWLIKSESDLARQAGKMFLSKFSLCLKFFWDATRADLVELKLDGHKETCERSVSSESFSRRTSAPWRKPGRTVRICSLWRCSRCSGELRTKMWRQIASSSLLQVRNAHIPCRVSRPHSLMFLPSVKVEMKGPHDYSSPADWPQMMVCTFFTTQLHCQIFLKSIFFFFLGEWLEILDLNISLRALIFPFAQHLSLLPPDLSHSLAAAGSQLNLMLSD